MVIFCDLLLFMLIAKMFCECSHNGKFSSQHTAATQSPMDNGGPSLGGFLLLGMYERST
jgi:hypothetical protein